MAWKRLRQIPRRPPWRTEITRAQDSLSREAFLAPLGKSVVPGKYTPAGLSYHQSGALAPTLPVSTDPRQSRRWHGERATADNRECQKTAEGQERRGPGWKRMKGHQVIRKTNKVWI
ncbi:hypothetical protein NDU88_001432 [Pleurodeles waltl]|uniref:Uncharacterized protein n=1 Tax=Pleurodeles waltl TaxID=8319 RepID=A0AAV7P7W8_PLEWA|nr:hypothetical protein NDU88_001432 [Pleurodeles waltl]